MTRPIPTDWQPPTDLRCVGGPAESNWYEVPPQGYIRREIRGGAYWEWNPEEAKGVVITGGLGVMGCGTLAYQRLPTKIADRPIPPSDDPELDALRQAAPGQIHTARPILTRPPWGRPCSPAEFQQTFGLPCESGPEPKP